jgi:hypothetical protein
MCAVTVAGGVKCWGQNLFGEIGDGTNCGITVPDGFLVQPDTRGRVDLVQEPPLPVPDTSGSSGASVDAAPDIVVVGAPDSDADGRGGGPGVRVHAGRRALARRRRSAKAERAGKSVKAIADVNSATLQMPPELAKPRGQARRRGRGEPRRQHRRRGRAEPDLRTGRIYIFKKPPDGWTGKVLPSQDPLSAPSPVNGDGLGTSIAITNAAPSSPGTRAASGAGVIFVIRKGDTTYTISAPIGAKFPLPGDGFGSSVSGEGSDIAVGAPNRDVDGNADQGQVQVFREAGGVINPIPIAVVDNPVASAGDQFGASVSLNDGALLVGAPGRDRRRRRTRERPRCSSRRRTPRRSRWCRARRWSIPPRRRGPRSAPRSRSRAAPRSSARRTRTSAGTWTRVAPWSGSRR